MKPCNHETKIVGILNVTPDSFSDGGKFDSRKKAVNQVKKMIKEGADIIDIGGESTGPGSQDVSLGEEFERVIPLIQEIKKKKIDIPISVDTYKAEVARQALSLGVEMINDVTALRGDPDMGDVLAEYKPYVVLMYSKDDTARTSIKSVEYKDVMKDIKHFLIHRVQMAIRYGIPKEKIILDPGMGAFVSMNPKYSFEIIHRLPELKELGYPIWIAPPRKSFLGGEVGKRFIKTLAASAICAYNGADFIRVHDVGENREVVDVVEACLNHDL